MVSCVDYHTFAKHNDPCMREIFNGILPKCVRALSIVLNALNLLTFIIQLIHL